MNPPWGKTQRVGDSRDLNKREMEGGDVIWSLGWRGMGGEKRKGALDALQKTEEGTKTGL